MKIVPLLIILMMILPAVHAIKGLQITVELDDAVYAGTNYTKLFMIKNLDHVSGQTEHINVSCGYSVSGLKEGVFTLTDLNYYKTANTGEFAPTAAGGYTICGWIINSTVDDANKTDDFACKDITVLNPGEELPKQQESAVQLETKQAESEIEILDIDDAARFGQTIDVKLRVYRGDTRKYAVYAEIEDISKETTMHFDDKFTNYTLTIPIQIKPNCKEEYPDGRYMLVVHGLETDDSERILVSGLTSSLCSKEKIVVEKNITVEAQCKNQTVQQITPRNAECLYQSYKKPKTIYESSSAKAGNLIPILMVAVLAAFTAVLIWRR